LVAGCYLPQVNEYRYEIERLTRELQVGTSYQPNQPTLSTKQPGFRMLLRRDLLSSSDDYKGGETDDRRGLCL
jgi:hypothetical protein